MKQHLNIILLLLCTVNVFAQQDTTIIVPRDAWKRYFDHANQPNHSPIDDHKNYHNMVIATDRPDQTETPNLVPKGRFQIETGAWVEKDEDNAFSYTSTTVNTTLWKFGLSDHAELRLITEYLRDKKNEKSTNLVTPYQGFNSVAIGGKFFICEEHKFIPKVSLITHLQLPYMGAKDYRPTNIAPRFRFLFQNTLSDRFSLSYNLGGEWDGISTNTTLIYSISLGINLIPNMAMFVESYGFLTENTGPNTQFKGDFINDHRLDAGVIYVLTNDLQLDVSGGIGINEISPDYFYSCGVSWRFPKASKVRNK